MLEKREEKTRQDLACTHNKVTADGSKESSFREQRPQPLAHHVLTGDLDRTRPGHHPGHVEPQSRMPLSMLWPVFSLQEWLFSRHRSRSECNGIQFPSALEEKERQWNNHDHFHSTLLLSSQAHSDKSQRHGSW